MLLGLEIFHYQAILGFVFLVAGTLIYNEIVVVPFLGFDQNTAAAIAARQRKGSKSADAQVDAGYVALSPAAAYDSKRNQRQLQKHIDQADQDYNAAPEGDYNLNLSDNTGAHDSQRSVDR